MPHRPTKISRAQQAAANAAAVAKARKAAPFVMGCLRAAGLKHARPAVENGVWEANAGNSSLTDHNAQVLASGPYKSKQAATNLAKSLRSIEYTASGGSFVASASLSSHLSTTVEKVGACLGR